MKHTTGGSVPSQDISTSVACKECMRQGTGKEYFPPHLYCKSLHINYILWVKSILFNEFFCNNMHFKKSRHNIYALELDNEKRTDYIAVFR